jgi:hypothetical protein
MDLKGKRCANPCVRKSGPKRLASATGKIIISRNYRGDVPMSAAEKFTQHL